jgi:SAM-dependent methyltransferase
MDAVSLARLGAHVTGVDFSAAALARASDIASRCGVQVDFVQADATDLPAVLHDRFDLVYATIGILNWIEDVDAWMRSVRSVLRKGGRLLLIDVHPLFAMFGSVDPLDADFPYASAGPVSFDEQGSYADREAVLSSTATVEFAHSLGRGCDGPPSDRACTSSTWRSTWSATSTRAVCWTRSLMAVQAPPRRSTARSSTP